MTKKAKTIAKTIAKASHVDSLETSIHESILLASSKPLKVLITRPEAKAQQLASLLDEQNITNIRQALFDYQPYASPQATDTALKSADILIFVSVAAVEFAHASSPLPVNSLQNNTSQLFFAVGNATKQALMAIGITQVLSPPLQQEHSEGLLKLPELTHVKSKKVVIFRGNGGREHIANGLIQRGANISYIESYQRVWRTLPKNIAHQWQAQQINCIVVTSNDILLALIKYLVGATDNTNNYWQTQCLWVVVSERIAQNAKNLGLTRVMNTHSASSQIICETLQKISC
jgi:uroporphyrinogen-III synthase